MTSRLICQLANNYNHITDRLLWHPLVSINRYKAFDEVGRMLGKSSQTPVTASLPFQYPYVKIFLDKIERQAHVIVRFSAGEAIVAQFLQGVVLKKVRKN